MTEPTSLPNFPPPPSERPLRGRVLDALIDEGFEPNIDDDGDVAFTMQDQQLFVFVVELNRVTGKLPDLPRSQIDHFFPCRFIKQTRGNNRGTLNPPGDSRGSFFDKCDCQHR